MTVVIKLDKLPMKRGSVLIVGILVFGGLIIIGSGILTARFIFNKNSATNPRISTGDAPKNVSLKESAKEEASDEKESTASESDQSSPSSIAYTQPDNLYTITLPAGWIVNSTTAINNYSTTKFTGDEGNISVTFGGGKDPIGGCSEASSIVLADRTISGCFLLQKDGSKLLTRGYTKTKSGLEITIEAYMNSPNAKNSPTVLGSIKTIDVN